MPTKATAAKSANAQLDEIRQLMTSPSVQRFAEQAMEMLPEDGPLRVNAEGFVVLELADAVLSLRIPTFGEYQQLSAAIEGADDAAEGLAWWRRAASILAGAELPPDESLPIWLCNPVYARQAQNTWLQRPTQAPGT